MNTAKTTLANAIKPGDLPVMMNKTTRDKANSMMRTYVKCLEEKKRLLATISEQMKATDLELKQVEEGLILLGQRYKEAFDSKGNFELEDGYLHIANYTIVETTKKFDASEFLTELPDLIDIKLKTALVKKEWLSKDGNKQLKALGVRVDTVEQMQVIANKKI